MNQLFKAKVQDRSMDKSQYKDASRNARIINNLIGDKVRNELDDKINDLIIFGSCSFVIKGE